MSQVRLIHSNLNFKYNISVIADLKHELAVWERAAASVSSYSKDEDAVRDTLLKKVRRLAGELKIKMKSVGVGEEVYKSNLEELQKKVEKISVNFFFCLYLCFDIFSIQSETDRC